MDDRSAIPKASARKAKLIAALPPICDVRRGALVWAIAMGFAAWAGVRFFDGGISGKQTTLEALFFMAGLFAWPFALFAARYMALGRSPVARFVASFAAFFAVTAGFTALFFSQQYRSFYAQWHEPVLSRVGLHEFVETSAVAVAQFVALGLKLYFPLGIVIFALASLWLARRMR